MSLKLRTDGLIAAVDAVAALVDVGTGTAQLMIWSGVEPVSATDAIDPDANTYLATFDLPSPAFGGAGAVVDGAEALAFSAADATAAGTGEATFFRIYDGGGIVLMQGVVSEDDDAPLKINQTNIVTGAAVSIERLVIGMAL